MSRAREGRPFLRAVDVETDSQPANFAARTNLYCRLVNIILEPLHDSGFRGGSTPVVCQVSTRSSQLERSTVVAHWRGKSGVAEGARGSR